MKIKSLLPLVAGALALTTFSVTALSQTTPPAEPPPPPPAGGSPTTGGHHEHHPAIRGAIRALERAKAELEHADHDFGGHRAEALAECEKAIQELRLALQYDKN